MNFDFFQFIISPDFTGWLFWIKIIFLLFIVLMGGFIIFALLRTTWLRRLIIWDLIEILTLHPYGAKKLYKQWIKLKSKLDTGVESECKLAIIEADSILNEVLKKMGFDGETLIEKLEKVPSVILSNIDDIRNAHKIRDNIVYDPDFKLSNDEAKKIMLIYEKALIDLQVL